ncbi:DNA mismatch repair protein MutS [Acidihalobacter yilgarnensis]|uniref:DNA mismatch repair protein MutS n=1 Tax=Acidihalobacter yilgarnensis TaxID=2819280 RepID=A0A1D8ILJ7_9GAMM|nr:DNA mismatch repair protein MutS [Acidihalobacter yilgarnensis]AOU97325.1 DNA mismatch repair protein MutS [Acidihalobacter yilgarnensis]
MHADLKPLEFNAIRRLLERLSATPYGADAARGLEPAPDIEVARRMQRAVDVARLLLDAGRRPPLGALPDIRAALRQAATVGASLSGQALFNLQEVMAGCARLAGALQQDAAIFPGRLDDLQPPTALVERLNRTLVGAGSLRDDANEALAALFVERRQLREEAEAVVRKRMQRADVSELFENVEKVSWQNERTVVVVRVAEAERIKGVRRGSALGGRDVAIEPMEAVPVNNRLEAVMGRIGTEQQRLFRDITAQVRTHVDALQAMIAALTWIDLALAAGRLSQAMNAHAPRLTDSAEVELNEAYHPLLLVQFADGTGPQPVPLSVRLDDRDRLLVITGPNTGGKTVALKTLGLLVAMAYCGLHIPAERDCIVGRYARLIVDVGDHQSLHHHLSTFAGHVEVLKRVLNEADGHTLVLLDELGTGTDPEEGAALAMAVLDELGARGVQGVVNTHLSPLKDYAADREGVRNASMHFDAETMRPTYELRIGVPGKSLGLIIAEQNGLPATLVAGARKHLQRLATTGHG